MNDWMGLKGYDEFAANTAIVAHWVSKSNENAAEFYKLVGQFRDTKIVEIFEEYDGPLEPGHPERELTSNIWLNFVIKHSP